MISELYSGIITKTENVYKNWISPAITKGGYFFIIFVSIHSLFWGIEQLHFRWCVGSGISGFITSMLTNQSGICSALRSVSSSITYSYTNLISGTVALISTQLLANKYTHNDDTNNVKC